jgi:hypothetical protein
VDGTSNFVASNREVILKTIQRVHQRAGPRPGYATRASQACTPSIDLKSSTLRAFTPG